MDTITSKPGGSGYPSIPTTSQMPSKSDSSIRSDTNRKLHDNMQLSQSKENTNRQMRINETNQQRENFLKIFSAKSFTKFYTIESTNPNENLAKIDVIKANRDMIKALKGARPKKVDELRDGTLLIEVFSEDQGQYLRKITSLANNPVKVSEHKYLNQTKGTIYYRNRCQYTEQEIQNELALQKVTNVHRITKKVDNENLPTNIYILTFNMNTIPEEVNIGWNKCKVREYVPRARRCFNCMGFQHSSKNCRIEKATCVNCGQEAHDSPCNRPACCKNCGENHPASSKDCFHYKVATEIVILQTREKISFREAKNKALQYIAKPEKQYSNAVRKRNNSDHLSDSEKSNNKKPKPQSAPLRSFGPPPASVQSQEMASPSTTVNQKKNIQQQQTPLLMRKAAVGANQKILASQSSIEPMDDSSRAASQTNRSRSTSKGRPKASGSK